MPAHYFFSLNDPPPPENYTLSLHDALPIYGDRRLSRHHDARDSSDEARKLRARRAGDSSGHLRRNRGGSPQRVRQGGRSEETRLNSSHSSNSYAVFCLKKKKKGNAVDMTLC